MDERKLGSVVRYLRAVAGAGNSRVRSDRQLLNDFAVQRDETAFEELVRRHGPMVLGVCRRVLSDSPDAEDAFQATFLVLVRKAHAIKKRSAVSSWLYGVAYRTAIRARSDLARRRAHEKQVITMAAFEPIPETIWHDLRPILDEEVNHLPAKYREPLVLCYLNDLTYEEAARQLGWPKGTVATRLARARELLRAKLTRRGIALSTGLVAVAMSPKMTAAALPPSLVQATVEGAALVAAGHAPVAVAASAKVAALTQGVLGTMMLLKMKTALVVLLTLGLAAAGAGVLLQEALVAQADQDQPERPFTATGKTEAPPAAPKASPEGTRKSSRPEKDADRLAPFAQRVWTITDLVLQNHLDPCSRSEMILAGTKALLQAAKVETPADLEKRIAQLTNADQFTAFLRQVWPTLDDPQALSAEKLEMALLDGLFKRVPGAPDFLPLAVVKAFTQASGNRYVGIGVQLSYDEKEKFPKIINPFRRGVAYQGGARPGDLIVAVNGKSTHEIGLSRTVEWLRGEEGTTLTMTVRKPGTSESRILPLTRSVVPFDTVYGYRRAGEESWTYRVDPDSAIGYVWIDAIRSSTLHELKQVERQLRAQGIRALVIDFRFSRGEGFLHTSAVLADGLLDGGLMWRIRSAHGEVKEYRADRECVFRDWPLVVLVNDIEERALGAVLAALQDNGRAILVGEATKVDGYGDRLVDLPDGQGSIRVRSFRIERPAPEKNWPVKPDHEVVLNEAQRKTIHDWLTAKQMPELSAGTTDKPPEDLQLAKAMALLREALKTPAPSGKR